MLTTLGQWIWLCICPIILLIIVSILTIFDKDKRYICILEDISFIIIISPIIYVFSILLTVILFAFLEIFAYDCGYKNYNYEVIKSQDISIYSLNKDTFQIGTKPNNKYVYLVYKDDHYEVEEVYASNYNIVYTDSIKPKVNKVTKICKKPKKLKWLFNNYDVDLDKNQQYGTIYIPKNSIVI